MANENSTPIVELTDVGKSFGNIRALSGVSLSVRAGDVTCILGDNGAGKSTLIEIISGLHRHDSGTYRVDGHPVTFLLAAGSPRPGHRDRLSGSGTGAVDARVAQLLPRLRAHLGPWPVRRLDTARMRKTADAELKKVGIHVPDIDQPVGTLSGGQRQVVAIARAIHFGARVLISDEPTAALGVRQSGVVLKYISAARDAGLGLIFITHNPHHAFMVGDHFVVLRQGELELSAPRAELALDHLTHHMAGGRRTRRPQTRTPAHRSPRRGRGPRDERSRLGGVTP